MDVSFSGLLSYIEERAEKLLQSGEYTKAASKIFSPLFISWCAQILTNLNFELNLYRYRTVVTIVADIETFMKSELE